MKPLLYVLLVLVGLNAQAADSPPFALKIQGGQAPAWRGISADEAAGTQGPAVLYPAPNAAGLLAAILTHAAIVQGARSSERTARQVAADKVLEQHSSTIASLSAEILLNAARDRLPAHALEMARGLVAEMDPRFALAPDQRTLILDNTLRLYAADSPASPLFENTIRVISEPCNADDPSDFWAAKDGAALKGESAALIAHSLLIALYPLASPDDKAFRTQRYLFGNLQKMERGQPVANGCSRIVLRTLRESLLSVPITPTEAGKQCGDPYALSSRQASELPARAHNQLNP